MRGESLKVGAETACIVWFSGSKFDWRLQDLPVRLPMQETYNDNVVMVDCNNGVVAIAFTTTALIFEVSERRLDETTHRDATRRDERF